ncbi:hypothetical protein EC968_010475 [Mortierella alpina]|nr:hypothetical protein EC968_010475 [Mortierella alpina]
MNSASCVYSVLPSTAESRDWLYTCASYLTDTRINSHHLSSRPISAHALGHQHNENTRAALRDLCHEGLVVDKAPVQTSSVPLASYIATTLLNFASLNQAPCPIQFSINIATSDNQQASLPVPARSRLLLSQLSCDLNIDIYVFSSRRKPIAFRQENVTLSIGFFHNLDSFLGVSEYLVLAASSDFENENTRTLAILPPQSFTSEYTPATFREHERGKRRSGKGGADGLAEEELQAAVKEACVERMKDIIQSELSKRTSLQDTKGKLLSFTYVPRGVQAKAFEAFRAEEENARSLSDFVLLHKLDKQASKLEIWKDVVIAEFDRLWCNAEAELIKKGDATKARKAAKTAKVRVKADPKGKGRAGQDNEEEEASDDSDSNDDSDSDDDGQEISKKEELRVCHATFKQIIRPDFDDADADRIIGLLEESQRSVTEVIEELSVLTRKAINVIANGSLYPNDMYEHGVPSQVTSFDLRTILPRGFVRRDPTVNLIIQVAPLPDFLQQYIESNAVGKRRGKDDISNLLSQAQRSSMHSQFLGLNRDKRKHSGKHPVWEQLEDALGRLSDCVDLPQSPAGLTLTLNTHIRQFATNVENLWHGSIYDKELDYFLRIYLRLHLAPRRESNFKKRVAEAARKEREKNEATRTQRRLDGSKSRNLWRSKVLELCNDLERATRRDERNSRKELENPLGRKQHVESILKNLIALQGSEPAPHDETSPAIAPLEVLIERQRLAEETDARDDDTQLENTEEESGEDQLAADMEELTFDDLEELDLDDFDWDEDEDDQDQKEPSRATLKSLQAVAKTLLESATVTHRISPNYVKGMAYVGTKFTDKQCMVVAHLVNTMRPYFPKRWIKNEQDGSDTPSAKTEPHTPHITLRAPFVFLANAFLRAAGYPQFIRRVAPQVSPAALHSLLLSASGIYEILCSREANHFDILDSDGLPLTHVRIVPRHKEAVFGAFFNLDRINEICHAHGIRFANRLTFVDRYTVQIMGRVIPHGPDRAAYPISSQFEARKKAKALRGPMNWGEEVAFQNMDTSQIQQMLKKVESDIKVLEETIKPLRSELNVLEQAQFNKKQEHKSISRVDKSRVPSVEPWSSPLERTAEKKAAYRSLQQAREQVRDSRDELAPMEDRLRQLRRERSYWNNVHRVAKSGAFSIQRTSPATTARRTVPTLSHYTVEDATQYLDITKLPRDRIAFAGTDPGVKTMSVTCAQTLSEIEQHVNRYQLLSGHNDDDSPDGSELSDESSLILADLDDDYSSSGFHRSDESSIILPDLGDDCSSRGSKLSYESSVILPDLDDECSPSGYDGSGESCVTRPDLNDDTCLPLPHPHQITAPQVNQLSYTKRIARKRERRLRNPQNAAAREAIQALSKKEQVLSTAQTFAEIDTANKLHRNLRGTLKNFESSKARLKDLHQQRLRTKRTWAKLAAHERRYVKNHATEQNTSPEIAYSKLDSDIDMIEAPGKNRISWRLPSPIPVFLIGAAGTGVGSRIKGHERRGGGKMREQHRQSAVVAITNEYRTSQTCYACFRQLRLARSRRFLNGKVKSISVHGAVECLNRNCDSVNLNTINTSHCRLDRSTASSTSGSIDAMGIPAGNAGLQD